MYFHRDYITRLIHTCVQYSVYNSTYTRVFSIVFITRLIRLISLETKEICFIYYIDFV